MQTLKIKYKTSQENLDLIKEYQIQYSSCLHYMYNRVKEGLDEKQCRDLFPQINNIDKLNFIFKECAIKDDIQVYNSFQQRYKEHEETREDSLKDIENKLVNKKLSKE